MNSEMMRTTTSRRVAHRVILQKSMTNGFLEKRANRGLFWTSKNTSELCQVVESCQSGLIAFKATTKPTINGL